MPCCWSEHECKRRSAVASGFKWAFGFAIGHRVADVLLGPRVVKLETVESSPRPPGALLLNKSSIAIGEDCDGQSKALLDCLDSNVSDISKCQSYLDMLKKCRLLQCLDSNVSDISKCQSYLDVLKKCRTDAKSTSSA